MNQLTTIFWQETKKQETIEQIEQAINLAHRVGLISQGYFVFGLPGEARLTIQETIRFAASSQLDRAQFLILDVLPGSALWRELAPEASWRKTSFAEPEWLPPGLSRQVLIDAQKQAFRKFYKNPRRALAFLKMVRISQAKTFGQRFSAFRLLSP